MERLPIIRFNQLSNEKYKGLVIKIRQGSAKMFPITMRMAIEELTNFGRTDAEAALKKSNDEDPIIAGDYVYWLNH